MNKKTPKHDDQNIGLLAEVVTDSSHMDAIIQHFYEDQYNYYKNDKEAFLTDWEDMNMGNELASYGEEAG